ncbi:MAG: hypothetical protein J1E81_09250 [Eubacterium sp.]|nr:hypothetical protein [Eubacterium sp.]
MMHTKSNLFPSGCVIVKIPLGHIPEYAPVNAILPSLAIRKNLLINS